MVQAQSNVQVTRELVFVDPQLIVIPLNPIPPGEDPDIDDYNKLNPTIPDDYRSFDRLVIPERDLLVNIETSGLKPFESRIISIAWLDTTELNPEVKVITGDDEKELIDIFFEMFEQRNFSRLVGWNLSFDYRFLWGIAALYRKQVKKWANIKLRDVQQIYQQVKEQFVYGFQTPNKQEEWSKFLFGVGKLFPQEEVLKRFITGDFEAVDAFNINQVTNLEDLYDLARYTSGEGFIQAPSGGFQPPTPFISPSAVPGTAPAQQKQCKNCLAFNSKDSKECVVCGDRI